MRIQQNESTRHTTTSTTQMTQTTSCTNTWNKQNYLITQTDIMRNKTKDMNDCRTIITEQTKHNVLVEGSSASKPCILNMQSRTKQMKQMDI